MKLCPKCGQPLPAKNRIGEYLEKRGKSQASVAREIGVTPMQMSRYVRGDRSVPADRRKQIAKALGTTMKTLFD
jgi:transcriptional regulator with XRE-family HTH domain